MFPWITKIMGFPRRGIKKLTWGRKYRVSLRAKLWGRREAWRIRLTRTLVCHCRRWCFIGYFPTFDDREQSNRLPKINLKQPEQRKSQSQSRDLPEGFNKRVVVLKSQVSQSPSSKISMKSDTSPEKLLLKKYITTQMKEKSKRQLSQFMAEAQEDIELQNKTLRDYDYKHKLKMDR